MKEGDILIIHTGYHHYGWDQPTADEIRYMVKHPGPGPRVRRVGQAEEAALDRRRLRQRRPPDEHHHPRLDAARRPRRPTRTSSAKYGKPLDEFFDDRQVPAHAHRDVQPRHHPRRVPGRRHRPAAQPARARSAASPGASSTASPASRASWRSWTTARYEELMKQKAKCRQDEVRRHRRRLRAAAARARQGRARKVAPSASGASGSHARTPRRCARRRGAERRAARPRRLRPRAGHHPAAGRRPAGRVAAAGSAAAPLGGRVRLARRDLARIVEGAPVRVPKAWSRRERCASSSRGSRSWTCGCGAGPRALDRPRCGRWRGTRPARRRPAPSSPRSPRRWRPTGPAATSAGSPCWSGRRGAHALRRRPARGRAGRRWTRGRAGDAAQLRERLCAGLERGTSRTTRLAAQMLEPRQLAAATPSRCWRCWRRWLARGRPRSAERTGAALLAVGHRSGADTLRGIVAVLERTARSGPAARGRPVPGSRRPARGPRCRGSGAAARGTRGWHDARRVRARAAPAGPPRRCPPRRRCPP